jgi:pyrroloquinoline quinone biosynthesis protein B
VMGAGGVPVYAMPRMAAFLAGNGPWSQLVELGNVEIRPLRDGQAVRLAEGLSVTPLLVPHRDEFSETVAFRIDGPERSMLFLPDVDKWERWATPLETVLATVDVAYLDGTFFAEGELPGRDMSQIPHPFIVETMERLRPLPAAERAKVRFIHLNHTNPALDPESDAARRIEAAGFAVAREMERQGL